MNREKIKSVAFVTLMLILAAYYVNNSRRKSSTATATWSRRDWKKPQWPMEPAQDSTENNNEMTTVPMSQIMSGKPIILEQDDKRIIDYIWKNQLLVPPSKLPYNLNSSYENDPSVGQSEFIRKLLGNMTNGFFVEAGAHHGEWLSNTLYMERYLNWKGLLVEGDPMNYATLKTKNRKAWISNTCLSVKPYPHKATFKQDDVYGQIVTDSKAGDTVTRMQCMPLFSLLTALNVTTVDYFSLDVEGGELKVLKTIPFDKVFIRALSIEHVWIPEGKKALREFMEGKGYKMAGVLLHHYADDVFFIHQNHNDKQVA